MNPATDPWCLWLRRRLMTLGVTPKSFAKQIGMTRQAVYWTLQDNGTLPPDSRIELLALVLGVSEDEVLRMRGMAWEHRGTPFGRRNPLCRPDHTPNHKAIA